MGFGGATAARQRGVGDPSQLAGVRGVAVMEAAWSRGTSTLTVSRLTVCVNARHVPPLVPAQVEGADTMPAPDDLAESKVAELSELVDVFGECVMHHAAARRLRA